MDGKDLIIPVPPGITVLFGGQGNSNTDLGLKWCENKVMGQLDEANEMLLVAKGGIGGMPSTDYLPTVGQSHAIVLDLKVCYCF